jgi:large subunit ribosomal protein L25
MELTIECQTRSTESKANALRRSGLIPAVLYGHNGAESVALTINAKSAELLVRSASLNNTLIEVNVPDLPWSGKALLREVQVHPWKRFIYHLSFFSVASQASLEVDVPLHFVGEPVGVKLNGGSLDLVVTSLRVKCAPGNIPDGITADISHLDLGQSLHVSDLLLPAGVVTLVKSEQVIANVKGEGGAAESESA